VLQHFDVCGPIGPRGADLGAEGAQGLRRKSAAANAGQVGMRDRPAIDPFFFHELEQLALAEQRVGEVEAIEFKLVRGEDAKLLEYTAVEGW